MQKPNIKFAKHCNKIQIAISILKNIVIDESIMQAVKLIAFYKLFHFVNIHKIFLKNYTLYSLSKYILHKNLFIFKKYI